MPHGHGRRGWMSSNGASAARFLFPPLPPPFLPSFSSGSGAWAAALSSEVRAESGRVEWERGRRRRRSHAAGGPALHEHARGGEC